jgi:hypothetical protein
MKLSEGKVPDMSPQDNSTGQGEGPSFWGSLKRMFGVSSAAPTEVGSKPKAVASPAETPQSAEAVVPPAPKAGDLPSSNPQSLAAPAIPVMDESVLADAALGRTMDDVPCGPFLVYSGRKQPVQVLDLAGKKSVTIGRSDHCDFFFNDSAVSRVHMVIEYTASGWTMRDMKSTYGSFLEDGSKLYEPHVLKNGERFRCGRRIDMLFVHAADLLKAFSSDDDGISIPSEAA